MVYFPGKIGRNSDNFTLTFRIKVNEWSDDLCPYFMPPKFFASPEFYVFRQHAERLCQ